MKKKTYLLEMEAPALTKSDLEIGNVCFHEY